MLTTMNQVATVLNKAADASTFSSQAVNVKNAFNQVFLNSGTGYYVGSGDSGYRQTHNLLALAFGLIPNATTAQVVADSISRDVVSRSNHLNTGALGTKYLLPVLSDHGHVDTAFALSQQTTFPSWGFWIANGANTMVRKLTIWHNNNKCSCVIIVGALGLGSTVSRPCQFCFPFNIYPLTPRTAFPRNI